MAQYKALFPRLLYACIGGGGFLALLAAAPHFPDLGDVMRGAALVWLTVFGVIATWRPARKDRR